MPSDGVALKCRMCTEVNNLYNAYCYVYFFLHIVETLCKRPMGDALSADHATCRSASQAFVGSGDEQCSRKHRDKCTEACVLHCDLTILSAFNNVEK